MMQFKILENFEGEHANFNACKIDMVSMPDKSEIAGVATFDPKLLWKFIKGIKRSHPKSFERSPRKPDQLMTVCLVYRNNPDTDECLTMLCHINGEFFALSPRISEEYQKIFDFDGKCVGSSPNEEEIRLRTLTDYHSYLVDTADEYWSQAEGRKLETDKESAKLTMELRQMHAHYSSMADEVLQYIEKI